MNGTTTLTTDDELLGIRLMHRAMRTDLHRLATTAAELARDDCPSLRRITALSDYLLLLATSIDTHHRIEDDELWPLLHTAVGPHIDLSELADDHAALESLLEELTADAHDLKAGGSGALTRVSGTLAQLRDMLDEHIDDEERTVFPLITGHVSSAQWSRVDVIAAGTAARFRHAPNHGRRIRAGEETTRQGGSRTIPCSRSCCRYSL